MGDEDITQGILTLSEPDRARAERLLKVAMENRRDPSYGGLLTALRIGSSPVAVAWIDAHESGIPYPTGPGDLDPVWEKAVHVLQAEMHSQEMRERAAWGQPTDETDFDNEEYFAELMQRDD